VLQENGRHFILTFFGRYVKWRVHVFGDGVQVGAVLEQ
jgi:hypothetical protein